MTVDEDFGQPRPIMVFHVYKKIQLVSDIWTEFTVTGYAAMLARLTLVPTEQTYLIWTLIIITFSIRVQLKCLFFSLRMNALR